MHRSLVALGGRKFIFSLITLGLSFWALQGYGITGGDYVTVVLGLSAIYIGGNVGEVVAGRSPRGNGD